MNNQINIQYGNWEQLLGDKWDSFQRHAEAFMRGYANAGRGAFERGMEGAAMLELAGEAIFYAFLKAQGIYKREANLCLDLFNVLKDKHQDVTENEWVAVSQLLTRPKVKRELFREAVRAVIGDPDPGKRAAKITSGWDGGYISDPPERDIEDKARALLESCGFHVMPDVPLGNGTRVDLVAEREDISLICECKAKLTLPDAEKALGQLRAFSYELPNHHQVIFCGRFNPTSEKLLTQAGLDGVRVFEVHQEQQVLQELRRKSA